MEKKVRYPFYLFILLLIFLTSCNEGKYEVKDGTVYYSRWTASFGQQYDELPEVDAATFESVEDWLGRDATHVYFKDRLVSGADPATIKAEDYPLFCDANDYYYKGAPLHVTDMRSFEVIELDDRRMWAKDSRTVYFDSLHVEGANPATFRLLDFLEGKDDRHVFYQDSILPDADPNTYEVLGLYSKDKSHVWYCGHLMEGADAASFHLDKEDEGVDKYGSFSNGERVR